MSQALQSLFPESVVTAESKPVIARNEVFPEEWALVEGAVAKRQAEFCGGRVSAHRALEGLGMKRVPILSNPDRSPKWPAGLVGSISHTISCCCAAVCREGEIIGLGLDVESASPLEDKLIMRITTEKERQWLSGQPGSARGLYGKLIFCIKEAAYKSQYPLTQQFIEFHQAQVNMDLEKQAFEVVLSGLCTGGFPQCERIRGRFALTPGHVLAGATVRLSA